MTALTLRPSALTPDREDSPLAESVYRTVTALRAIPDLAAESLAPDFYLAAVDSAAPSDAPVRDQKEPRT